MKKILFNSFLILMTFATLTGCKRGEEDPFLSFRSRDSRVTGTWELKKATLVMTTTISTSGSLNTETYTISIESGILTETGPGGSGGSSVYTREITLEKDGTYKATDNSDGYISEESGNWWWLNDSKNKTRLAFDDDYSSYLVEQLKNKEIILTRSIYYKETEPSGDWEEETEELRMIYEKK